MKDYTKCSEPELINCIKADKDSPALDVMIGRYRDYIDSRIAKYNLDAADRPELFADACIGLYSAAQHFDPERGVPFGPYAKICMKRAIFASLKRRYRSKNASFADCLYLEDISGGFPERTLELFCEYGDPQSMYLRKEELKEFFSKAEETLTPFEWSVFRLYCEDLSYAAIASELGRDVKSISNAVYRIRRKLSVIDAVNI